MFFRRAARHKEPDKPEVAEAAPPPVVVEQQPIVAVVETIASTRVGLSPLPTAALRRVTDAASLGFVTTADLEPLDVPPGQDRVVEAIELAAAMGQADFHLAVIGPRNTDKRSFVKSILARNSSATKASPDYVYARFMTTNDTPRPVALPAGAARSFAGQFSDAIASLRETLPAALAAENVMIRRRAIEDEHRAGRDEAFAALDRRAAEQNIAVLRTPTGFAMAPVHVGKVVKPEVFSRLPEAMQRDVEERVAALQVELEVLLADVSVQDKIKRQRLLELETSAAQFAVHAALKALRSAWLNAPDVQALLDAVVPDILGNAGLFYDKRAGHGADPVVQRYAMSVMCSGHASARPLVEAGELTREALLGTALPGLRLAQPGLLHRASGGYLLIEAGLALAAADARRSLIEAVRTDHIALIDQSDHEREVPQPIPLDVRLVLTGDRSKFAALTDADPAFANLFKVVAVFDEAPERSTDHESSFARHIALIASARGIKPIEATGVAALIEESARLAGHRDRLSCELGRIANLVCEADHWAGVSGRKTIKRLDVTRAIEESRHRMQALHDRWRLNAQRNVDAVLSAAGSAGLIRAVSLHQVCGQVLAAPCKIEGVVGIAAPPPGRNLEPGAIAVFRQFLAQRYRSAPPDAALLITSPDGFVLPAASGCAEICALLSALCQIPIRAGYAATGGVLVSGRLTAADNINDLIEGYFDAMMTLRDGSGAIGIVIPASNVGELMLREDVVDAVDAGRFEIYGAATIEEAMEVLTSVPGVAVARGDRLTVATFDRVMRDALRNEGDEAGVVPVNGSCLRAAS